ncbi:MAG: DUF302 domain-containing protein [Pseudomonadota bacterium]
MKRAILAGLLALAAALPAAAQQAVTYDTEAGFDDAAFALENAIINRGLVVDHVSHVGAMLERTREDVGSDETLFEAADVYVFCSATLSREVMEADPMNVAHCPYGVFVAERQGEVMVGYRSYPEGPMQKVQTLLDEIAREAAGM